MEAVKARMALGDLAGAEAVLRAALTDLAEEPSFYTLLATLRLQQGDAREALALADQVPAATKGSPDWILLRAHVMLSGGATPEDTRLFLEESLANLREVDERLLAMLLRAQIAAGAHDGAVSTAVRMLERGTLDPEAVLTFATAKFAAGQADEVIAAFDQPLRGRATHPLVAAVLAAACTRTAAPQEAVAWRALALAGIPGVFPTAADMDGLIDHLAKL